MPAPCCVCSARARIALRTLESLIFGDKHPKISVRFVYKSLKFWEHHSKNSLVLGFRRTQDTRLGGSHGTGAPCASRGHTRQRCSRRQCWARRSGTGALLRACRVGMCPTRRACECLSTAMLNNAMEHINYKHIIKSHIC